MWGSSVYVGYRSKTGLTATHTIAAIQAFVAGPAPNSDMAAGITGRSVALHAFGRRIDRLQPILHFHSPRGRGLSHPHLMGVGLRGGLRGLGWLAGSFTDDPDIA
jgi:hypothetical protein